MSYNGPNPYPSPETYPKQLYKTRDRLVNTQILHTAGQDYQLPIVNFKCAGLQIAGLIDTGASASLLTLSEFNKIKHDSTIKCSEVSVNIRSISGDSLQIIGSYIIPISINNIHFRHKFYITNNSLPVHYQAILGYDLLKAHNFILNLESNTLTTNCKHISINSINLSASPTQNTVITEYARLPTKLTLLPKQSKLVNLKLNMLVKGGEDVLFTPVLQNHKIEIHNSLCSVNTDKTITIPISNLTMETI